MLTHSFSLLYRIVTPSVDGQQAWPQGDSWAEALEDPSSLRSLLPPWVASSGRLSRRQWRNTRGANYSSIQQGSTGKESTRDLWRSQNGLAHVLDGKLSARTLAQRLLMTHHNSQHDLFPLFVETMRSTNAFEGDITSASVPVFKYGRVGSKWQT